MPHHVDSQRAAAAVGDGPPAVTAAPLRALRPLRSTSEAGRR